MRYLTLRLSLILLLVLSLAWTTQVKAVLAAPHFTLTPATGTATVGSNLDVVVGIDTGTEKMVGGDIQLVFDATRFELASVSKVAAPAFNFAYNQGDALISNTAGTMGLSLLPLDSSVYSGTVASGPLLTLSFRPKATGTATVSYTCVAGAIAKDTNIINTTSADVIDCASNQSGSYTVNAAAGGSADPTSTPIPTTTTTTTSTLPKTGAISTTIAMMVVGIVSVVGAAMLKWL